MPPPRTMDPIEAFQAIRRECQLGAPELVSVEEALGRILAEDLSLPGDSVRRSLLDGFAVPRGVRLEVGSVFPLAKPGGSVVGDELGSLVRVDVGAAVPDAVASVLPVGCVTYEGADRVRVDQLAGETTGISEPGASRSIAAGVAISARLQAVCLASGLESMAVYPRVKVAHIAIGSELVDSRLGVGGTESGVLDQGGIWIPEALRMLPVDVVSLGLCPDEPEAIRAVFSRAKHRGAKVLIATGGLGDGIGDRTREAFHSLNGRVVFERVAVTSVEPLLYARSMGVEVFALCGSPGAAAFQFDVWVFPALLARCGVAAHFWDWSLSQFAEPGLWSAERGEQPLEAARLDCSGVCWGLRSPTGRLASSMLFGAR